MSANVRARPCKCLCKCGRPCKCANVRGSANVCKCGRGRTPANVAANVRAGARYRVTRVKHTRGRAWRGSRGCRDQAAPLPGVEGWQLLGRGDPEQFRHRGRVEVIHPGTAAADPPINIGAKKNQKKFKKNLQEIKKRLIFAVLNKTKGAGDAPKKGAFFVPEII